jgi:hypothetical protein
LFTAETQRFAVPCLGHRLLRSPKDCLQLFNQRRKVLLNDIPQDIQIHGVIAVDQPIAQPNDFGPGYLPMSLLTSLRNPRRGLPDDLDDTRQARQSISSLSKSSRVRPSIIATAFLG